MPRTVPILAAVLVAAFAGGCQTRDLAPLALASAGPVVVAAPAAPAEDIAPGGGATGGCIAPPAGRGTLAGRTIAVSRISDIALAKGEVVLTFDDGPRPGTTPRVLDALDAAGVRATFLMVGQMARAYPGLVRAVAARGHTIGTHTDDHANLTKMSTDAAFSDIARGEKAVAAALSGSGHAAAPFFRFPYLADSPSLRAALARRGTVVLDVDIDSRDYVKSSPAAVLARTMATLKARGRGIILFHDIHARTAAALPGFLASLSTEGFRVVHLVPAGWPGCGSPGA